MIVVFPIRALVVPGPTLVLRVHQNNKGYFFLFFGLSKKIVTKYNKV